MNKNTNAPSEIILPQSVYEINIVCGGAAATTPKQHRHAAQWNIYLFSCLFESTFTLFCNAEF